MLLVGFVVVCLLFVEVGFHHVAQIDPRCLLLLLSEGVLVLVVFPSVMYLYVHKMSLCGMYAMP